MRQTGGTTMGGLVAIIGAALATSAVHADPAPAPAVRTFSSLCSDAENGDFRGMRIAVQGEGASLSVTVEEPAGAILATTTTKDVTFTPADGRLRFKIQDEAETATFEGTMSTTMLEGTLAREDGTREAVHLPQDKGGDSDVACRVAPDTGKP